MSEAALLSRTRTRDVEADLNYLAPGVDQPRTYTFPPPDGVPATTAASEPHRVLIRDLRALEEKPALDREGFALIHHTTAVRDFGDESEVRSRFYPEVEHALAVATGAARVFIFDHTIRRRIPGVQDRGAAAPRQPVSRVHVDHTARSGPKRVRDHPLAVADARTVEFSDLVPSALVYPHRVGETYSVRHNPRHRWYYAPDMWPDEALLLKCFDSATDGRARFSPHTAFLDPTAPADAPPRESIEVRALLFHSARA